MLALRDFTLPNFYYPDFVIPAKAGIHHRNERLSRHSFRKLLAQVMDSRLRGNDELGEGSDEVRNGCDEVTGRRTGR